MNVKAHVTILPAKSIVLFCANPISVQPAMMKGVASKIMPLLPILSLMIPPGIITTNTQMFKTGANHAFVVSSSWRSGSSSFSNWGSAAVGYPIVVPTKTKTKQTPNELRTYFKRLKRLTITFTNQILWCSFKLDHFKFNQLDETQSSLKKLEVFTYLCPISKFRLRNQIHCLDKEMWKDSKIFLNWMKAKFFAYKVNSF